MQVYSYVMTIVKNKFLAEEITQQTFFKAMSCKASFKGIAKEFTWLCSIAKNLAMDYFRKESKCIDFFNEDMPSDVDMLKKIEQHDTSLQIHLVLHDLNEPYKEVFQLRIFGDLSFSDIGKIFSKSENWARVTYYRAKLKIKERMDKDDKR